jgi:hypothetical protein
VNIFPSIQAGSYQEEAKIIAVKPKRSKRCIWNYSDTRWLLSIPNGMEPKISDAATNNVQ